MSSIGLRAAVSQTMSNLTLTRRKALQMFAAQMALTVAGCSKPNEEIVPYVQMPEGLIPGEPLRFATALPIDGYGQGILAISVDGRPIKVEGNPRHPASLGATDAFAEAAILTLYDPDRSRTPTENGAIASWDAFRAALLPKLEHHDRTAGDGLRLVTGRITSPTLLRQIDSLLTRYPLARWHVHEPIDDRMERRGDVLAFGRAVHPLLHLDRVAVMLCLDADPLGPGPTQVRNARQWIQARNSKDPQKFSQVYVAESVLTLTGTKADYRLAVDPTKISNIAIAVANVLDARLPHATLSPDLARFAEASAHDLLAHKGQALVLAGRTQPAEVHALAHWMNAQLEAPLDLIDPFDRTSSDRPLTLEALADDLHAGRVETLIVVGSNPAYTAPFDLSMAEALKKAPFTVHLGSYADETAVLCRWHLPQSHTLESWSDLRAIDGSAAIVQPLIRPLYASRSAHELLAMLAGQNDAAPYDLVRDTWRPTGGAAFEEWWRQALHDGVVAGSTPQALNIATPEVPDIKPFDGRGGFSLVLSPDPSAWDGRFANSPWLQECPKPVSKEVWGNALRYSKPAACSCHDAVVESLTPPLLECSAAGWPPSVANKIIRRGVVYR